MMGMYGVCVSVYAHRHTHTHTHTCTQSFPWCTVVDHFTWLHITGRRWEYVSFISPFWSRLLLFKSRTLSEPGALSIKQSESVRGVMRLPEYWWKCELLPHTLTWRHTVNTAWSFCTREWQRDSWVWNNEMYEYVYNNDMQKYVFSAWLKVCKSFAEHCFGRFYEINEFLWDYCCLFSNASLIDYTPYCAAFCST